MIPQHEEDYYLKFYITTYSYVAIKYSPLSRLECLRDLVKQLKVALDEMHALNMSHNDIRFVLMTILTLSL